MYVYDRVYGNCQCLTPSEFEIVLLLTLCCWGMYTNGSSSWRTLCQHVECASGLPSALLS